MPKLFCMPLLVKDNYDTVGMAATNGAYGLLDNIPAQDAYQVSKASACLFLLVAKLSHGALAHPAHTWSSGRKAPKLQRFKVLD